MVFPHGPELELFKVKSLTILKYGKIERRIVENLSDTSTGMDGIKAMLEHDNHPEAAANIVGAKLYARFKSAPAGMRRYVTVQLGWPNRHNFADKVTHNQLRDYLIKWGVAVQNTDEIASAYA